MVPGKTDIKTKNIKMSDIPVRNRNMLGILKKLEINICINSVMAINAYKNLSVAMSHELDIPYHVVWRI